MNNVNVHLVLWIAALVLGILALVGVSFPALPIAVLCGAAAELIGDTAVAR